jgi:hypothetical protein
MLHHLVGLPEGEELADHDGSREDFDEADDTVVNLVPAEGIVEEATGSWDPEWQPTSRSSPTDRRFLPGVRPSCSPLRIGFLHFALSAFF